MSFARMTVNQSESVRSQSGFGIPQLFKDGQVREIRRGGIRKGRGATASSRAIAGGAMSYASFSNFLFD